MLAVIYAAESASPGRRWIVNKKEFARWISNANSLDSPSASKDPTAPSIELHWISGGLRLKLWWLWLLLLWSLVCHYREYIVLLATRPGRHYAACSNSHHAHRLLPSKISAFGAVENLLFTFFHHTDKPRHVFSSTKYSLSILLS